jgi:hypothetical protein
MSDDPFDDWYNKHKTEFKCAEAKLNATTFLIGLAFVLVIFFGVK